MSKRVSGFRHGLSASLHPITVSPFSLKSCDFGDPLSVAEKNHRFFSEEEAKRKREVISLWKFTECVSLR